MKIKRIKFQNYTVFEDGTPIKEKISGSDLFPRLCNMAAKKGYKLFFLNLYVLLACIIYI